MPNSSGDQISGELGDQARSAAIGKQIEQDNRSGDFHTEINYADDRRDSPPHEHDMDDDMVDLIKAVERLEGEMKSHGSRVEGEINLLRFRVVQLEDTTKIGIVLYVATMIMIVAYIYFAG